MNMGLRIKELRKQNKLTQLELATQLELSLDMVKSIEQGRKSPSVETLNKLADHFDVSTDYLLCRTDNRNEKVPLTWTDMNKVLHEFLDAIEDFNPKRAKEIRELFLTFQQEDREITPEENEKYGKILEPFVNRLDSIQ